MEVRWKGIRLTKVQKWLMAIFVFLCCVICVFLLSLDAIVKNKVTKEVYEASDGKYKLEIKSLDAKFFSGAITMDSVWLKPTTEFKIEEEGGKKHVPNIRFYLHTVSISSIDWFRYLLSQKRLLIGNVVLNNPELFVKSNLNESSSIKAGNKDFLDYLPGIIAAFIGSLQIESILIKDGVISVNLYGDDFSVFQRAEDVDFVLNEIKIDTTKTNKVLFSKESIVNISNYNLSTSDGMYRATIKNIAGQIHDSTLCLTKIQFFRRDKDELERKNELGVKLESLDAKGVDFNSLFRAKKVTFRNMRVDKPDVAIYNSIPPDTTENKSTQSILEQVAPFIGKSFNVDTLAIQDGRLFHKYQKSVGSITQSAEDVSMYFTRVKVDSSIQKERLFVEDIKLKVSNYVFNDSDSIKISVGSLNASVSDSLLDLKDIDVTSIKGDQIAFSASNIKGEGVNYLDILDSKVTKFSYLGIEHPEVYVRSDGKNKKSDKEVNFLTKLAQPLSEFKIFSAVTKVNNGKFYHTVISPKSEIVQRANHVYLKVTDLGVNKAAVEEKNFFNQLSLKWENYKIKIPRQNFFISIEKGNINYEKKSIALDSIQISQLHSHSPYQRHYFMNNISKVTVNGLDYDRFLKDYNVNAKELVVDRMNLYLSLDEQHIDTTENKVVTPQILIRKIPFALSLDTVAIKYSQFAFDDKLNDTASSRIELNSIALSMKNFTNDPGKVLQNPIIVRGVAHLQGEPVIQMQLLMPDLKDELNLKLEGEMGAVDGQVFNDILRLNGLQVRSGTFHDSQFKMVIRNGIVCGDLLLPYNNLKLDLIDTSTFKRRSRFKNSVANFILADNNPPKPDEELKIVGLNGDFNGEYNFLQFVWGVLQNGMISTVTKNSLFDRFAKR